jgi:Fe-S cluster biogenesis protein NfuA
MASVVTAVVVDGGRVRVRIWWRVEVLVEVVLGAAAVEACRRWWLGEMEVLLVGSCACCILSKSAFSSEIKADLDCVWCCLDNW